MTTQLCPSSSTLLRARHIEPGIPSIRSNLDCTPVLADGPFRRKLCSCRESWIQSARFSEKPRAILTDSAEVFIPADEVEFDLVLIRFEVWIKGAGLAQTYIVLTVVRQRSFGRRIRHVRAVECAADCLEPREPRDARLRGRESWKAVDAPTTARTGGRRWRQTRGNRVTSCHLTQNSVSPPRPSFWPVITRLPFNIP